VKLVVFGLSVTSARGNGHATFWRGILRALAADGHEVVFFERDNQLLSGHRDLVRGEGYEIVVYPSWATVAARARREVANADVAIVTSFQADAAAASEIVLASKRMRVFYDLDTPLTLERLDQGELVSWLPAGGLGAFDLVLSITGGVALDRLRRELGARRVAPLFGCADLDAYRPGSSRVDLACDLSYLGAGAVDCRPNALGLFFDVAERAPSRRFLLGEPSFGGDLERSNLEVLKHVPAADHAAFFSSSRLTLNLTSSRTARLGYCPSSRLFEAAACGAPIISNAWRGLDAFFEPSSELLIAESADDVLAMLELSPAVLAALARSARERVMAEHTATHRARELVELVRSMPRRASAA
jgi:spore maturation protein CgeB